MPRLLIKIKWRHGTEFISVDPDFLPSPGSYMKSSECWKGAAQRRTESIALNVDSQSSLGVNVARYNPSECSAFAAWSSGFTESQVGEGKATNSKPWKVAMSCTQEASPVMSAIRCESSSPSLAVLRWSRSLGRFSMLDVKYFSVWPSCCATAA